MHFQITVGIHLSKILWQDKLSCFQKQWKSNPQIIHTIIGKLPFPVLTCDPALTWVKARGQRSEVKLPCDILAAEG